MKYLLILALLMLAGCSSSSPPSVHYFTSYDAIGKTFRDKDGCAVIIIRNEYGNLALQPLVDESASTCKLFAANSDPAPAQSVN